MIKQKKHISNGFFKSSNLCSEILSGLPSEECVLGETKEVKEARWLALKAYKEAEAKILLAQAEKEAQQKEQREKYYQILEEF